MARDRLLIVDRGTRDRGSWRLLPLNVRLAAVRSRIYACSIRRRRAGWRQHCGGWSPAFSETPDVPGRSGDAEALKTRRVQTRVEGSLRRTPKSALCVSWPHVGQRAVVADNE